MSTWGDLTGNPVDSLIYYVVEGFYDTLEARDVETGETVWTHSFSGNPDLLDDAGSNSNLILADGVLYYNTLEQLYAFDAATGEITYHVDLVEPIWLNSGESQMAMANNIVYIAYLYGDSQGSFVHAYNATTGDFLGKLPDQTTASGVHVVPVIASGQLYILYDRTELVVYGPETTPPP